MVTIMHSFKNIIKHLKSLRRLKDTTERFTLAYQYNSMYFDTNKPGCRWMCPSCNKVHYAKELNGYHGSLFEACCEFPAGTRNTKSCAIKKINFHFWK